MEMSKNRFVTKVADSAHLCPISILYTNKNFLSSITHEMVSEESSRVAAQIRELNSCLDGEKECDLDHKQIKAILNDISTTNL